MRRNDDYPQPGDTGLSPSEVGIRVGISRRDFIKAGAGVAAGVGLAAAAGTAAAPPAEAGIRKLAKANARRIGGTTQTAQLTGQGLTSQYGVRYTDLCIPVERYDGVLFFIAGDSYSDAGYGPDPHADWRSPVAFSSTVTNSQGRAVINGTVIDGPSHAKALVPQAADKPDTMITLLPTDAFCVGRTLYMHAVRGRLGTPQRSEFYNCTDGGRTWNLLRAWTPDEYGGQFQQKTYAAATAPEPDGKDYVYVMSTAFQRETVSGLLLFRVLKSDLDANQTVIDKSGFGQRFAYQAWGYANGRWAWGNQPTTITDARNWGEICFRAIDRQFVLSWFQPYRPDQRLADCRAMVFPLPTSDLFQRTEQTMVYSSTYNPSAENNLEFCETFPYGPFIFPRSTLANFNFVVSSWQRDYNSVDGQPRYGSDNPHNYSVSQWKTSLNPNI